MKKLIALVLFTALLISSCFALNSCTANDEYTIGILQLAPHPALDAATEGFKQALIDELGEENISFLLQNAQGDPNTCTTIATDFVNKNVDLIMANATNALQAAYSATEIIPILGTSVTEYGVALGIDNFSGTVGSNVSGTSDLAPLDQQVAVITELFPDAKKVALVYCSAEPNSLYQVNEVKKLLESKGIAADLKSFSDNNDIQTLVSSVANSYDVIYVPTDNAVANATDIVKNAAGNTPVIAGEEGICSGCGVATVSINYYDLGYTTGKMAAKILRKETSIEDMAIEYAEKFTKKYNPVIAAEFGFSADQLEALGYTAIEMGEQ